MARNRYRAVGSVVVLMGALAGCDDLPNPFAERTASGASVGRAATTVEREVEAPEIFEVSERGLWDGRPSFGGIWVAHPDVDEPVQVIIRNQENDRFTVGALFKRERETPGPRLQVSSDAAEALGMLAGQPEELNVVALIREEVPVEAPEAEAEEADAAPEASEDGTIEVAALAPVAAAAIDRAEAEAPTEAQSAAPAPEATPAPAPASETLSRPFIQIGIFSVEANAERAADLMRDTGIVPLVKPQKTQDREFFRVLVGPASTSAERDRLLAAAKGKGFRDAYFVTR